MKLHHIDYDTLTAKQKEIYNFQKSASILADYGFNCIKLTDDWKGADFLAYHLDGATTLKVQLKGRLTVAEKYIGLDLWMNFPVDEVWYLIPHDKLVAVVGKTTNWLNTKSWLEYGRYSSNSPSPNLLAELRPFALEAGSSRAAIEGQLSPSVVHTEPAAPKVKPHRPGVKSWPNSISIRKNLIGRGVVRRFAFNGVRYEVSHDDLVRIVGEVTPWLQSGSWINRGGYGTSKPSKALLDELRPFAVNPSV